MKKIILSCLSLFILFTGCQNELYKDALEDHKSDQGVYLKSNDLLQSFVAEGQDTYINDVIVNLARKTNNKVSVDIQAGSQDQLDAYNEKNRTNYPLLPSEMYEINDQLVFESGYTSQILPIKIKDLAFNGNSTYALPIKIKGDCTNIIPGQDETILVLEQKIITKCLRMNGSGSEDENMFPNDFKVDQWTMEVMINRNNYRSNNRSICGTKLAKNSSNNDEIYPRFGDVTIEPNQLQIKTGNSQIDVPKDKFEAKPNEWYMISFVYDGHKHYVYINGELVADREIREGAYGLVGFWLGGLNELVREVRFWKTARTHKQIRDNVWKTIHPDSDDLLLYYPGNGKKYDHESKQITEDESMIWDWSKNENHLKLPSGAIFDNNNGEYFVFPPQV